MLGAPAMMRAAGRPSGKPNVVYILADDLGWGDIDEYNAHSAIPTPPVEVEPAADGVKGQLYNLADDPHEPYNLWAQRPEIVQRLTKLLDQYKECGHTRYRSRRGLRGHGRGCDHRWADLSRNIFS
jgi:arylsulfatase A-like enzyme